MEIRILMPPIIGSNITDALLAAYMPITGRLLRRYRDNINALNTQTLAPDAKVAETLLGPTSFTTIRTIRLFVPDCMIGNNGTLFHYNIEIYFDHSGAANADFRILADGNASPSVNLVITEAGSDSSTPSFEVTATVTPNTIVDVEFQVQGNIVVDTLRMGWNDGTYFAAQ